MKIIRFKNKDLHGFGRLKDGIVTPLKGGNTPFDCDLSEDCFEKDICFKLEDCQLLTPVNPSKVIGVALNYPGVSNQEPSEEPLVFLKSSNAVVSSGTDVSLPRSLPAWGESELAVIIKDETKDISENQKVEDCILGYCVANDVTCDNTERRDHHLAISKSQDGFCPIGSFIETDYQYENKTIRGYQNGELIREGNTIEMLFDVEKIVRYLSTCMTLFPGDIILTGAPSRVREKIYLSKGDAYSVSIEGLEEITTQFI
jgi:2-keto-4-pentenoate hydratase/2-oxohepta-3-ene-1,7-dioic acid hydratase in catechol pathway